MAWHIMNKISFEDWLETQKNRDDSIGDLAKDFIAAKTLYPEHKNKLTRSILIRYDACEGALNAYEKARREYEELGSENEM